jgi:hypothetical protein
MKTIIHKDEYHRITHDASTNLIRIDWLPDTAKMSLDDFKHSLTILVDATVANSAKSMLVDLRAFHFKSAHEVEAWRMQNTVPKYNKVIKRWAWLATAQIPQLPGDGKAHQNEGEAYHRRWFRDEAEALSWATSDVKL